MPISLTTLLNSVSQDTETRVRKARDTNRELVREALKSECRLQFRTEHESGKKDQTIQVPVDLTPGLPDLLRDVDFPINFDLALLLSRYRFALEQSSHNLEAILLMVKEINERQEWRPLTERGGPATSETQVMVKSLLGKLNMEDPLSRILGVNDDTLGAYCFNSTPDDTGEFTTRIQLYWGVIGLVAQWLPATVEDVTIVTLTHELAHAYTHLGADINGNRWPSVAFSKTEKSVVEGLAQYYTHRVLIRLAKKLPKTIEVFDAMLKRQGKAYHAHKPWEKNCTPEAVRRALLEFRFHLESSLTDFEERLEQAQAGFEVETS